MNLARLFIFAVMLLFPSVGMAREEPAPDMDMLEFLGVFETAAGKPVDPLVFSNDSAQRIKKERADTSKKNKKRGSKPETQEQKGQTDEK